MERFADKAQQPTNATMSTAQQPMTIQSFQTTEGHARTEKAGANTKARQDQHLTYQEQDTTDTLVLMAKRSSTNALTTGRDGASKKHFTFPTTETVRDSRAQNASRIGMIPAQNAPQQNAATITSYETALGYRQLQKQQNNSKTHNKNSALRKMSREMLSDNANRESPNKDTAFLSSLQEQINSATPYRRKTTEDTNLLLPTGKKSSNGDAKTTASPTPRSTHKHRTASAKHTETAAHTTTSRESGATKDSPETAPKAMRITTSTTKKTQATSKTKPFLTP